MHAFKMELSIGSLPFATARQHQVSVSYHARKFNVHTMSFVYVLCVCYAHSNFYGSSIHIKICRMQ